MTPKELEKFLKKLQEEVEVKVDTPTSFRIFIYTQRNRYPIIAYVRRQKKLKIVKFSEYPKQEGHYPIVVLRVERLRIMKKYRKRKTSATSKTTKTIIKETKDNCKRK